VSDGENKSELSDPVCGKPVDPLRARAVGIYGGVTHYFCSPECKAKYTDPRAADQGPPPGGERRLGASESSTGEWFAAGPRPAAAPPLVERFTDLEAGAVPERSMAPSPSLLVEVAASKRRIPWAFVGIGALAVVGLGWLLLAR